jgi:AcrR family transcriptional regulator
VPQKSERALDLTVAEQRRRQIVDAAREIIAEEGADKTRLRNVARRAGVSHATITYYFRSRKAMVDAALLDATEDFLEQMREGHKDAFGPVALVDFAERFLSPDNHGGALVIELLDAGLHDEALQRAHIELMTLGGGWVEEAVRSGVDSGYFRRDIDAKLAAAAYHAALLWVGAQMRGGTVPPDHAKGVALQALDLLRPPKPSSAAEDTVTSNLQVQKTPEAVRQILLADEALKPDVATSLAQTIENLYDLALKASAAIEA